MSLDLRTTIGTNHVFIDLYDDEPVTISISAAEIYDITQKNSAFSQSFTVPGTKNNNDIFNYYYDLSSIPTTFNPNNKFETIMMWDGYEIMRGNIRLEGVVVEKDDIQYEITFYNQVGDLAANIGDKFLAQLNLSGLSHPYTEEVITYSQQDPNLMPLTGATNYSYQNGKTMWGLYNIGYVYLTGDSVNFLTTPLVQFTPVSGGTYSPLNGYFDFSGTPVNDFYFKPTIQIKTLYEEIVKQAGYSIESDFFDTSYFQRFYMPLKFLDETIYPANAQLPCYTIEQSAQTVSSGIRNYIDPLNNRICNNLGWSANTQGFIIPSQNALGAYTWRISYTVEATNFCSPIFSNDAAAVLYWDDNLTNPGYEIFASYLGCTGQTPPQQINLELTIETSGNPLFVSFYFAGQQTLVTNFRAEIINAPKFLVSGQTIDYAIEFPPNDYKQIDFITSINRYFNLVVVPSPDKPDVLIVEPIVDYYGKGAVLDWTKKIDHLQPKSIKPTTSIINGTLNYNFQLDQDYANQNYKTASNRIFGTDKVNLNIDYKNQSTNFDLIFSSPIDITILSSFANMLTLSSFSKVNQKDQGGKPIFNFLPFKILPRVVFRGLTLPNENWGFVSGVTSSFQEWYSNQYGNVQDYDHFTNINRFTTYPFNYNNFSHYINWRGSDQTTIQPAEFAFLADDLYDIYYKDYIDDLTSLENKVYSAKIYLYPCDVKELKFNEKILVDNNYYRINKIDNFNLLEPSIADIELIKFTRDYNGHRIKYYDLYSCTGGTNYHSNSDLNYNLYAYIGNYVTLYDDNLNYLGCYGVSAGTYNTAYTYQHFYLTSGYTSSGVGVFDDCSCTGRTAFIVVQETPVPTPSPTPTPGLSPSPTPSFTPTLTPTKTVTPTPGLSPTPTPSATPATCNCIQAITFDPNGFTIGYYDCNGQAAQYVIPGVDVGLQFSFCGSGPFTTISGSGTVADTGIACVGGNCP